MVEYPIHNMTTKTIKVSLNPTTAFMLYMECQRSINARKNVISKYNYELSLQKKLKRPDKLWVARCKWYIDLASEHLADWETSAKHLKPAYNKYKATVAR